VQAVAAAFDDTTYLAIKRMERTPATTPISAGAGSGIL